MAKFCSNCGKEVNENADVCLNCGVLVNNNTINQNNLPDKNYKQQNLYKEKTPGKGLSIAGMVLGIISASWVLIKLLQVGNIKSNLSLNIFRNFNESFVIGYAIGFTLFSLIPSVIGLILSIFGMKKQKTGINTSGLLLNIIALCVSIIYFVYILSFL